MVKLLVEINEGDIKKTEEGRLDMEDIASRLLDDTKELGGRIKWSSKYFPIVVLEFPMPPVDIIIKYLEKLSYVAKVEEDRQVHTLY